LVLAKIAYMGKVDWDIRTIATFNEQKAFNCPLGAPNPKKKKKRKRK